MPQGRKRRRNFEKEEEKEKACTIRARLVWIGRSLASPCRKHLLGSGIRDQAEIMLIA